MKPNNSHMLLAFVINGGIVTVGGNQVTLANKCFSTGANDAILTSKGLTSKGLPFTASRYQALPVGRGPATGTTQQTSRYRLVCQPLRSGLRYYRLRQVDRDDACWRPMAVWYTSSSYLTVRPLKKW